MGQLNIGLLFAVFMTSAVLGDAVNYAIGNKLGGSSLTERCVRTLGPECSGVSIEPLSNTPSRV
jgi:membrane protein DedA with SNARE-associated domain